MVQVSVTMKDRQDRNDLCVYVLCVCVSLSAPPPPGMKYSFFLETLDFPSKTDSVALM